VDHPLLNEHLDQLLEEEGIALFAAGQQVAQGRRHQLHALQDLPTSRRLSCQEVNTVLCREVRER